MKLYRHHDGAKSTFGVILALLKLLIPLAFAAGA
jgi:hypothetical protein